MDCAVYLILNAFTVNDTLLSDVRSQKTTSPYGPSKYVSRPPTLQTFRLVWTLSMPGQPHQCGAGTACLVEPGERVQLLRTIEQCHGVCMWAMDMSYCGT